MPCVTMTQTNTYPHIYACIYTHSYIHINSLTYPPKYTHKQTFAWKIASSLKVPQRRHNASTHTQTYTFAYIHKHLYDMADANKGNNTKMI